MQLLSLYIASSRDIAPTNYAAAFTEALTLTEDGYYANPTFHYRKRITDEWEPGMVTTYKKVYPRTVDSLPYTYFWVFCTCPIFGGNCSVCLAVLCGGLRYGVAALHPKTKDNYVKLFYENEYDSIGQYTLCGYLRTRTEPQPQSQSTSILEL